MTTPMTRERGSGGRATPTRTDKKRHDRYDSDGDADRHLDDATGRRTGRKRNKAGEDNEEQDSAGLGAGSNPGRAGGKTGMGGVAAWSLTMPRTPRPVAANAPNATQKNSRAYEREVKRLPRLDDLANEAVCAFLREKEAYQATLAHEGALPTSLRLLIDPLLVPVGIRRFVRNMGGKDAEAMLPTEDAVARDEMVAVSDNTGEWEATATEVWDHVVRQALWAVKAKQQHSVTNTMAEAERVIKAKMSWDASEKDCVAALNKFTAAFARQDELHAIRSVLHDGGETGKRLVRALNGKLLPPAFRMIVQEKTVTDDIRTFDGWCDTVLDFEKEYEGMMIHQKEKTAAAHPARGGWNGRKPGGHARGGFYNTSPTPFRAKVAATATNARPQWHASPRPLPAANTMPSQPCRICGERHWTQLCPRRGQPASRGRGRGQRGRGGTPFHSPRRPEQITADRASGGPPRHQARTVYAAPDDDAGGGDDNVYVATSGDNYYEPRMSVKYTAKQANSDGGKDGILIAGRAALLFTLDTGASRSFASDYDVRQLTKEVPTAVLEDLETAVEVEVADNGVLRCHRRLLMPATLQFADGQRAELHQLQLYVVNGLKAGEVLIGRSTIRALGVDIVTAVKTALLSTVAPPIDEMTQEVHLDDERQLMWAAKRVAEAARNGQDTHAALLRAAADNTTEDHLSEEGEGPDDCSDDLNKHSSTEDNPTRRDIEMDDNVMDIAAHDPADVRKTLKERVRAAAEAGLPQHVADELERQVLGPLNNVFRNVMSDDPPARVEPLRVEVLPSVYALKPPRARRYHKEGSDAMAAIMARLEKFKFVYKNRDATIVSPAYPVKKAHCPPRTKLEDQYRITVDLRAVNSCTVPTWFPIPRLETFMSRLAGKRWFGTADLNSGYWQLPLHPDSQKYFSILTDAGVWTPTRLVQGSRNAAGPFHAAVSEALGDLLNTACVLYIDDVMVFGEDEEEFVENWIKVLQRLDSVGLKVNAKKTTFYAQQVRYCGRVFTKDGAEFDPELVTAITKMSEPATAAELRSYLATANWIRSSIPRYAELTQPLQDLLTTALATCKGRHKNEAKRVMLEEVGWNNTHRQAFRAINAAVASSVRLAFPDDRKTFCVFTDASKTHWAGVVTQVADEELSKPLLDQQHEPLAFVSGAFSGSSARWPIIEQEGFAILETLTRCEHLLKRTRGFQLYTDHSNLVYIFSRQPGVKRQSADRLERWSIVLSSFHYNIQHVPGEDNVLSDLLTRWGAATPDDNDTDTTTTRGDQAKVATTRSKARTTASPGTPPELTRVDPDTAAARANATAPPGTPPVPIRVDNTRARTTAPAGQVPEPRVALHAADTARDEAAVRFTTIQQRSLELDPTDAPTLQEIARIQHVITDAEKKTYNLRLTTTGRLAGCFCDTNGKVYIPDARHLRLRLYIAAHQGLGGHRSADTTLAWLQQHFIWPRMRDDVRTMARACLHCLRSKGGKAVHRPYLAIPVPDGPNRVIHFDFVFVRRPKTPGDHQYVLTLVDGFSRFVWLVPAAAPTARVTADALMNWFSLFGIVPQWISDQGTHFKNELLREMRYRLGTEHCFTTPYAPWSNGLVERVGRDLRETLSALISETRLDPNNWVILLPIVTSVLNNAPSRVLNGAAPITAFLGKKPVSPLDVIVNGDDGVHTDVPLTADGITAAIRDLETSMNACVRAIGRSPNTKHPRRQGEKDIDFTIGDYVLIARATAAHKDMTAPIWEGPAVVIDTAGERSFRVKHLLTNVVRVVHSEYLRRYADKHLQVTKQLKDFVAASVIETQVREIVDHRVVPRSRKWQLKVYWLGFEDNEYTWEDLQKLYQDVPELVLRYIKTVDDDGVQASMRVEVVRESV